MWVHVGAVCGETQMQRSTEVQHMRTRMSRVPALMPLWVQRERDPQVCQEFYSRMDSLSMSKPPIPLVCAVCVGAKKARAHRRGLARRRRSEIAPNVSIK